jgi:hypothetical protein
MYAIGYLQTVVASSVFLTTDKEAFNVYKKMNLNIFYVDLGSQFNSDMSYGTERPTICLCIRGLSS